jgi:hypothetical protein
MLVNSEAACVVLKGGSCEPDTRTNAGFVTVTSLNSLSSE